VIEPTLARRFTNERAELVSLLEPLAAFATLAQSFGDPPTSHAVALTGLELLVTRLVDDRRQPPERFAPSRHGALHLHFAADPLRHPYTPWLVRLRTREDIEVFNPHVATGPGLKKGLLCWLDESGQHAPARYTLGLVARQALLILSAQWIALEGFALNEDAKVWFSRHRGQWPFARIPFRLPAATPSRTRGPVRFRAREERP
jgi:hypothetical protein